jgi:hypothetical protein
MQRSILIILYFGFLTLSCRNPFTDSDNPNNSGKFENYTFEQSVLCFCPAPPAGVFYKLTVRNNEIVAAENTQTGEKLDAREFDFFKTISGLIELVDSINEDSVAVFNVTYDEEHGYPTYVYIDYSFNIADEEIGYRSRNFERD